MRPHESATSREEIGRLCRHSLELQTTITKYIPTFPQKINPKVFEKVTSLLDSLASLAH